jgi:hypothetical protein
VAHSASQVSTLGLGCFADPWVHPHSQYCSCTSCLPLVGSLSRILGLGERFSASGAGSQSTQYPCSGTRQQTVGTSAARVILVARLSLARGAVHCRRGRASGSHKPRASILGLNEEGMRGTRELDCDSAKATGEAIG